MLSRLRVAVSIPKLPDSPGLHSVGFATLPIDGAFYLDGWPGLCLGILGGGCRASVALVPAVVVFLVSVVVVPLISLAAVAAEATPYFTGWMERRVHVDV